MKKTTLAILLSGLISTTAMADNIGIYIGGHIWDNEAEGALGGDKTGLIDFDLKDQEEGSFFIAIEHPLPFIPNLKISSTTLDTTGNTTLTKEFEFGGEVFEINSEVDALFDVSYLDYTLYYEFFDNDILSFDGGFSVRDFDGDVIIKNELITGTLRITDMVPLLYASTNVGIPGTGFNFFAEGNFLSYDDHTLYDYQAGVSYELLDNLAVDLNLILGYRVIKLELEDLDGLYSDVEFKGAFAGAVVHF